MFLVVFLRKCSTSALGAALAPMDRGRMGAHDQKQMSTACGRRSSISRLTKCAARLLFAAPCFAAPTYVAADSPSSTCTHALPPAFEDFNAGAKCFAAYGGWGPLCLPGHQFRNDCTNQCQHCADSVGLAYPADFMETVAGHEDEQTATLASLPTSLRPLLRSRGSGRGGSGTTFVSMWNPAAKARNPFAFLSNGSLTILGNNTYFETLAQLKKDCELTRGMGSSVDSTATSSELRATPKTLGAVGAASGEVVGSVLPSSSPSTLVATTTKTTGAAQSLSHRTTPVPVGLYYLLHDMALSGLSFFFLKDLAVAGLSPAERDASWNAWVAENLLASTTSGSVQSDGQTAGPETTGTAPTAIAARLSGLFLCVHNVDYIGKWGFKASVPYLHLHVTDQSHYPEFVPLQRPWKGPGDFEYQGAWNERGAACASLAIQEILEDNHPRDDSTDSSSYLLESFLEKVTLKLWDLVPPYKTQSIEIYAETKETVGGKTRRGPGLEGAEKDSANVENLNIGETDEAETLYE